MAMEGDNAETPLLSPQQQPFPNDQYSDFTNKLSNIDEILEALPIGPFHYIFILACSLCYISYILCYDAIGFIIITACDLHINGANKGWLSLFFMAGTLSSCYITGKLCDRFGRRKLLLICVIIHIFVTIIAAFSYNYTMLLVTFCIIGMCDGGVLTTSTSYNVEFFPNLFEEKLVEVES